jgi:chaperonin GroES
VSDFPLKVFGARAVIKIDRPEEVTVGGIIIPESNLEPVNRGTVVAVGEGQRLDSGATFPMSIAIGDVVLYSPMAGAPVEVTGYDEDSFLILNESHILAIVE